MFSFKVVSVIIVLIGFCKDKHFLLKQRIIFPKNVMPIAFFLKNESPYCIFSTIVASVTSLRSVGLRQISTKSAEGATSKRVVR